MNMQTDPRILELLEAGQMSAAKQVLLPRRKLGVWETALLVALRVYVLLALPLVAYAFVHALSAGSK